MEDGDLDGPITRENLIARIQKGRKALDVVIQSFAEEDLSRPGPERWSVKDHLAHMTAWAKGVVALLHKQPRWEGMGLSRSRIEGLDEDAINEMLYQQNRERSLAEVQADFQRTYEDLITTIQGLEDKDLTRGYLYFQPFEGETERPWPIVTLINGNSWAHYEEHIPWIQTIQRSLKQD